MFLRMTIANNIKTNLPKTDSAKEFMRLLGKRSQIVDKSVARTLISTLVTMKFDGSRTTYEHVVEMTNIATRLRPWE